MYDVIIIGAGPTGATTAKTLAENDMNVLVVERMKLPRNKSCSGMLIKKTVDLVKKYFGEIVPDSVKCTPYDNCGMFFTDKNGKEFSFPKDITFDDAYKQIGNTVCVLVVRTIADKIFKLFV